MASDFENVALHALSQAQCCIRSCLYRQTSSYDDTVRLVRECRQDVYNLDRLQKRDFIRDVVRSCINGKISNLLRGVILGNILRVGNKSGRLNLENGRLSMDWKLKTKSISIEGICRKAFCIAYGIGNTSLTEICSEIKVKKLNNYLRIYLIFYRLIH